MYIYTYIYIYKLNHFAIHQKLTHIVNQLYFNKLNFERREKALSLLKPFAEVRFCYRLIQYVLLSYSYSVLGVT